MAATTSRDDIRRFRNQAIDSALNGMGFADPQGCLTYVNRAFLRMWGYESENEVLGRHVTSFGYSVEQSRAIVDEILRTGSWVGETTAKRKNGDPFVVEMLGSLVTDGRGTVLGMMGSFIDITGRKRVEGALRESEGRYRTLVESAQDLIFTCDTTGRFSYVNFAAAAKLGATPDDVIGKTVDELFPAHIAAQYRAGVSRVVSTGRDLASEDLSEVGGRTAWFSTILQPIRDRQGQVIAAQAIVRDITKLKEAEAALRESEERLHQAVRVANVGIFDHNHVTGTLFLSPEMRQIAGLSPDATVSGADYLTAGRSRPAFLDAVHPDDRERIAAAIRSAHEGGDGVYDVEFRRIHPDGTVRWVTVRSQTFFEGHGASRQPVRTVGATRDITEQKEAEEERARLHAQLVQAHKMESLGRLAGGVAHDFSNMLSVIIGYLELITRQVEPSGPISADLQQIRNAAQRSVDLTRQLLAFARRQAVTPTVINLNEVVAGSLPMLRRLIGEDVNLVWLPGSDLWVVRMDPVQIHQILANLSANARDAITGVGQVTIRTSNVTLDDVSCVTGLLPGEYVSLEVADNGRGMDHETQAHIFEPFYTTKTDGQGTGLGLATVYGVAQQNKGLVHAHSEVGRGTTVTIFLPRVMDAITAVPVQDRAEGPQSGTETVLLVEDEPMVLRLNTRSLERLGYSVLPATGPREALRIAEENAGQIDLLITDMVMPVMNGLALANHLASREPGLKVLFVSGYSESTLAHHRTLDERRHFLAKPFSLNDLAARVRTVLDA